MTTASRVPLKDVSLDVATWNPLKADPNDSFQYIDLSAIDQERKVVTGARELLCSEAPSRARQLVAPRDVLVSTVRPNLNGVAFVPTELGKATASTGFCIIRANPKLLDANYAFHWVKSAEFVASMVRQATGASYPAVSDKIVLDSLIPLPPLSEQRRIAGILDKADDIRTKRREVLTQFELLTQSMFLDMFGDPLTNSKGWEDNLTLGEVSQIVSGVTKGRKLDGKATRQVPYLAVANVQDMKLNLNPVKQIEATEDEIARYALKAGDLLLTEGGDPDKLGRGTLWHNELPECIHQNHVFRVRLTSDRLTPYYLNWLVGSQRGKRYFLKSAKQTTGIASINMTQLRGFPLLAPPLDLQQKFEQRIVALRRNRERLLAANLAYEALFSSLQHRAFQEGF